MEYGVYITHIQCMDDRPQHFYCGISGTVCTVEYCTLDSIANAKVSILVRPMSVVNRSRYYGGSPSRGFVVQRTLEDYYGSNLQPCFIHDGDVNLWPSRNSPSRIEPGSVGSKTRALTFITYLVLMIRTLVLKCYPTFEIIVKGLLRADVVHIINPL